jgi:hypothetical protein
VNDLNFKVDMPDREEHGQDVVCPAGGKTETFAKPFMAKPQIGITIQSANVGDYYNLSSVSQNNFTIQIRDSGNNGVERTIDWLAKGY